MAASTESTLLYVHGGPLEDAARTALRASAEALGHKDGCSFATPDELVEYGRRFADGGTQEPALLGFAIRALDPWAVVAVDAGAITALQVAFGARSAALAPDAPLEVDGYTLVAVPDFAACLNDQPAKRVAWSRLKAAKHPDNPLD